MTFHRPDRRAVLGGALGALACPALLRAQPAGHVRLGQATTSLSFLPVWSARALGSFEQQGLALDWAAIPGGDPNALAALDSGDLDLAAVGSETALQAIARGQPFTFVMSLMPAVTLQLVVSTSFAGKAGLDADAPLPRKLAALKGATIGVSAIGGAQERAARWLATKAGLDPKSAIQPVMVGGPPALQAALENGRIDGFVLSPPEGTIAEAGGYGRVLLGFSESFPELRRAHFLVLVARTPISDPGRERLVRTVRALLSANSATLADPAKAAAAIRAKFFAKAPDGTVETAVRTMAPDLAGGGRFAKPEIARLLAFASETGLKLDRTLSDRNEDGGFWTNALLDAAAAG